jgi:hypothetical protein
MAKFKFLGTETCPDTITLRDIEFAKGKAVEVEDDNFAAKLSALDYFAEVKPRGRKAAEDEQDEA